MKDKHHDELLNDVLAEAATPEFRAELFEKTLRHARRRKQTRRIAQGTIMLAILFSGLFFVLRTEPVSHRPLVALKPKATPAWLVHSQPLPEEMIVQTEPQAAEIVASSGSTVAFIKSAPAAQLYKVIDDDELFSLLDGRPAALVRNGTNVELVFVNPEDQKGFPVR